MTLEINNSQTLICMKPTPAVFYSKFPQEGIVVKIYNLVQQPSEKGAGERSRAQ